jgi:asparagine synthase (glutamine-hydrolysing)
VCGIAGFVVARGGVSRDDLAAMARRQAHRGPDGAGIFVAPDGGVGLTMNLLSIVGSPSNPGPYVDEFTGVALTYNGEVYNYRELASQWGIKLHPGESDAHLVLRAYLRWGSECLEHFDGMFAMAVYDPGKQQVFLARDRFGEKPLYYMLNDEKLLFASEVKALGAVTALTPTFPPEWITVESPLGSATPYADVSLLEAGHHLTLDLRTWSVTRRCWWSIESRPTGSAIRVRSPASHGSRAAAFIDRFGAHAQRRA